MSATAKEVRGFDHLILNMETCNVAVFDMAQSWHRANRVEYAVFGSKCVVLRASYCRHTHNGYGDTFTWITRLVYAKLQIRWIWLAPDLARLKPDEALCVCQSKWNITRIELSTNLESKCSHVDLNIYSWTCKIAFWQVLAETRVDIAQTSWWVM